MSTHISSGDIPVIPNSESVGFQSLGPGTGDTKMHAPKIQDSPGTLLEPFAVGLQSWANLTVFLSPSSRNPWFLGHPRLDCWRRLRQQPWKLWRPSRLSWSWNAIWNDGVADVANNFGVFFYPRKIGKTSRNTHWNNIFLEILQDISTEHFCQVLSLGKGRQLHGISRCRVPRQACHHRRLCKTESAGWFWRMFLQ